MTDDLIVARATAPGVGAVAIVRLDGAGAGALAHAMFRPAGGADLSSSPRRMVLGDWFDAAGEAIDRGMAVFFRAPHSYTGNDLVEFHCHGGAVPSRRLIDRATELGARPAEPGEFTRRAFLNGRMDLAQAEAVADLINAQTDAAARLARGQLVGALTGRVGALREGLIVLAAEIEARIDFPEEDLGEADRLRLAAMFGEAAAGIMAMLATRRRGRLVREGARVALVGAPNAGKSSLLNALARHERAIVTPHAGTTRDTVECTIDLEGVPLLLIDTAGLRASDDPVERIGIERSRRAIAEADLVAEVRDVTQPAAAGPDAALETRPADLVVWNKCDLLPSGAEAPVGGIAVSALRGDGLAALERALAAQLLGGSGGESEIAVAARHAELLERAARSLAAARASFDAGASGEFTMVDLREAIDDLSAVLGVQTGDAILDRVFAGFCIGK